MPCSLDIHYKKKHYSPNDLITGYILLSSEDPLLIQSITLTINKETFISIEESPSEGVEEKSEKSEKDLGRFAIYEDRERTQLQGIFHFPFTLRLPREEGATVNYTLSHSSKRVTFYNKYTTKAFVTIYGIYKPISVSHREINVVEEEPVEDNIRERYHLFSCLCIYKGSLDLEVAIQRTLYAGKSYDLKVSLYSKERELSVSYNASIEIEVESKGLNYYLLVEVPVTVSDNVITLPDHLPSSSVKNDLFSVKYFLVVEAMDGEMRVESRREVYIRNREAYGSRPSINTGVEHIYPERHLTII